MVGLVFLFKKFFLHLYMCIYNVHNVYTCVEVGGQQLELVSLCHVGAGDQTQVIQFGDRYPYRTISLSQVIFILRPFLCSFEACTGTCSVHQAGLELTEIHLPLPPECWD